MTQATTWDTFTDRGEGRSIILRRPARVGALRKFDWKVLSPFADDALSTPSSERSARRIAAAADKQFAEWEAAGRPIDIWTGRDRGVRTERES